MVTEQDELGQIAKAPRPTSGTKFGHWTTTGNYSEYDGPTSPTKWEVVCVCGVRRFVFRWSLVSGDSKSCGCQRGEDRRKKLESYWMNRYVNKRFGRLFVTEVYRKEIKNRFELWAKAFCDCGNKTELRATCLTMKEKPTRSCGCIAKEETSKRSISHGMESHYLYPTWKNMKNRCYNPNAKKFHRYGARGIQVASEWKDDPKAFIDWVLENLGERPKGYSLDRINNNGNYEPKNLRWADAFTQASNRG